MKKCLFTRVSGEAGSRGTCYDHTYLSELRVSRETSRKIHNKSSLEEDGFFQNEIGYSAAFHYGFKKKKKKAGVSFRYLWALAV